MAPIVQARPQLATARHGFQSFSTELGDGGGAAVAVAGAQIGAAMRRNAERAKRRADNAWVAETTAQAQLDWMERAAAAEREAAIDADGHVEGLRAQWADWRAETLAGAPSEDAQAAAARFSELQVSVIGQARAFEAQRRTEHRIGALEAAQDVRINAVIRGADVAAQIGAVEGDIAAARGEGLIDAPAADDLKAAARRGLFEADLMRRLEASPQAALSVLDSGAYDAELAPKTILRLRQTARAELAGRRAAFERRMAAQTRDVMGAVDRGYDHAGEDALRAQLAAAGMTAQLADLDQAIAARDFAEGFGRMAPREQAAVLARAGDTVGGAEEAQFRDRLDRLHAQTVKAVADDPLAHYARVHGLALEAADGADAAAIAQRADWAAAAQAAYGVAVPIYANDEAAALGDRLAATAPDEAVAIVGAHAQALDPPTYRATLSAIAKKQPAVAVAGVIAQRDAALARDVLAGQKALNQQPDVLPPKGDYLSDVEDHLGDAFAFDPVARAATVQAALALYAGRRFAAGAVSRDYDPRELRWAIDDVTGGVYAINGAHVLAPRPSVDADAFAALIESLTAADIAAAGGAVDPTGRAVDVGDFAAARYPALGDGRYLVQFGDGFAQRVDGAGATVLDLGALVDAGRLLPRAAAPPGIEGMSP